MNARSISVDLFCGYGGSSEGHRRALGRGPDVAINHAPSAIRNHAANFTSTLHLQSDVYAVDPRSVARGRRVDLLTASPDCGHYSRARGGKPRDSRIRDLGWVVVEWAREVRPRRIIVENVPEYRTWGPLHPEGHPNAGQPDPERAGETWRAWVAALILCGYVVDWRELAACDYGAPTTRRRLFVQARCDGLPIRWPEPTHGPGRAHPWRTAAECIDWSDLGVSIFGRPHPLAEATERRIAEGLRRYVIESPDPFLLARDGGVVAPLLVQSGYGERRAQRPRALDIGAPLGTVVAGGAKHALASAWLVKNYSGVIGHSPARPLGAVTTIDHHGLATAAFEPVPDHREACAAFIVKYYGQGSQWSDVREPMHTIVTKARMGLVVIDLDGVPYELVDIRYRMLQPDELARAQGFGPDYRWTGTKAERIAGIGHSVCPDVMAALIHGGA